MWRLITIPSAVDWDGGLEIVLIIYPGSTGAPILIRRLKHLLVQRCPDIEYFNRQLMEKNFCEMQQKNKKRREKEVKANERE